MGRNEFAMLGFMLTTEIQQDTDTGPVALNPRWLRIPSAVKYSGLSRSRLYELLAQNRIRSICLKSHSRALRGVRLVDRESIDAFMESYRKSSQSLPTDEA
jgi:predicted DNA-binding transcriptional regulator AlpA